MTELNTKQVGQVEQELSEKGISLLALRQDLLDHICCAIEYKLEQGKSFSIAFEEAFSAFGDTGLLRIQLETEELLNQKENPMKTTTFISGIIAGALITTGSYFKMQHWLGANISILTGVIILIVVFIPSIFIIEYKKEFSRIGKAAQLIGMFSLMLFILGFLLRLLHWLGAESLIYTGAGASILIYLPMLIYKNSLEKITMARNKYIIVTFVLSIAGLAFMSLKGPAVSTGQVIAIESNHIKKTMELFQKQEQLLLQTFGDSVLQTATNLKVQTDAVIHYVDGLKTSLLAVAIKIPIENVGKLQHDDPNIERLLTGKENTQNIILDEIGLNKADTLFLKMSSLPQLSNLQNKEAWISANFENKTFSDAYHTLSLMQLQMKEQELNALIALK